MVEATSPSTADQTMNQSFVFVTTSPGAAPTMTGDP